MAVTVLHTVRKTLGDMGSPKSLKHSDLGSAPPSLRSTTSLKSKKSHLKLSVLHRSQGAHSGYLDSGGIKNKDFNALSPIPSLARKAEEMSHTGVSYEDAENVVRRQKRPETTQRNPTRSRTILRLFSSKILARSSAPTPSQPLLRSPTQIVSAFGSKETRDAALRERGLLPPIEFNVDLSLAERERDRHLPVLTTPWDEETFAVDEQGRKISAAARVKQEWEAKCKGTTFGGLTSSPLLPIPQASVEQLSASACCEIHNLSRQTITSAQFTKGKESLVSLARSNHLDDSGHPTKPQQYSPYSEPYLIPLPPSPSPSSIFRRSREDLVITSVASLPLPPSSGPSAPPVSPTISIPPPIIYASAPGHHSPTRSKSSLVLNASLPVIAVPALVTSDSTSPNLLDNGSIVMIESPVKETSPLPGLSTISDCPHDSGDSEVPVPSDLSAAGSTDLRKARARNFTDPVGLKRKLSFNPFKSSADFRPNTASPRRLSMGASISNIRRSLAGSFLRPKASSVLAVSGKKAFDVPNLPLSPTLPCPCADQAGVSPVVNPRLSTTFLQEQRRPALPELTTRVPVSPILYSWRSIVAETNNIEDDESRRMTELAFLG